MTSILDELFLVLTIVTVEASGVDLAGKKLSDVIGEIWILRFCKHGTRRNDHYRTGH